MAAYAVFIRESTRNPSELATYSQKVGRTLAGHPVKVLAAYGPREVLEGPEVEGVALPSTRRRRGTTARPTVRCGSIGSGVPTTGR